MLNIIAIKTNKGYYISDQLQRSDYQRSAIPNYFYDGVNPASTFHQHWFFVENPVTKVEKEVHVPPANKRYVLTDGTLGDRYPLEFKYEDVIDEVDGGLTTEFALIRPLYTYKEDIQPSKLETVSFTFSILAEIDEIKHTTFGYRTVKQWDKPEYIVNQKCIKYDIIDEIITPSILLDDKPCSLSSDDSYKLIRAYIKENINPKVAVITSDYNFCFAVKKKVKLAKPLEWKVERKQGRRKWEDTVFVASREVQVFEMTSATDKYKGYTVIQGFTGENSAKLKENIDSYLQDLIDYINEPLVECEHCNGQGVKIENLYRQTKPD